MHPLAIGTQLDAWRVVARQSQGAYGAIYRAVRVGSEHLGPAALKLSLLPGDARFPREAELLSRLSHPGIPRLLDRGVLHSASGAEHSYFVMEWVEGLPLYAWAKHHSPSHWQVCRVLAGLARTLAAVHASGAVHRDVKGDNVLVRLSDRLPVLVDFGSCHFQGAPRLTWNSLAPLTPGYVSPQACRFDILLARHRDSYYEPCPADDLYALGVTAYRLVMGDYPPAMNARRDESGAWQLTSTDPRPLLESTPRVEPSLRELILRLLSETPEARGTAAQVAEALEAAAEESVPQRLPQPPPAVEVSPLNAPAPAIHREPSKHVRPLVQTWTWKPWPALAIAGVCAVFLWNVQPASTQQASGAQAPDKGTTAVGDTSPTRPQAPAPHPKDKKPLAQESPPKPRPGQPKPDKKGRCLGPRQVPINGGCWLESLPMSAEECAANSYVPFKGKCYAPALPPPKEPQPTLSPAEPR